MDDPVRQWTELEFREGRRLVPDYLVLMLRDIPTHRLTYEDAIAQANRKLASDYVDAQRDRVIAAHFKEPR